MLFYFIRPTLYFLCIGLLNAYPLAATIQCDEKEKSNKGSFLFNNSSMDLDPTKKLRSINPTQQEEPLFIETLPPEIWWSILDYLTNRHDLENLRRESRDFAWLIQDYLNNKEQKLGLTEPHLKLTYWKLPPEERKLIRTELKYTDPDRKLQNLNELKKIVTYLKGQERIERTPVRAEESLSSKVTEERYQIYKVLESKAKSFILGHLHDREATVSLDEDMEEVDELALLLNTVIKPLPLFQEEISPSELYYQALRLHYYCSQLFRLLGFENDAYTQLMLAKKSLAQNRDEPNTLYFAFKHNLASDPKQLQGLLRKAANNLNEEASFNIINLKAQYHLGKLYEKGDQGIKANIYKAFDWYEEALKKAESFSTLHKWNRIFINIKEGHIARKIYAKSHHRLGMLDLTGRTLKGVDFENALEHFLEASFYGHAKAQAFLGLLHYLEVPGVTLELLTYYHTQVSNHIYHPHLENLNEGWLKEENSKWRPHSKEWQRKWAFYWSQRAALQGSNDGFFQLGTLCEQSYDSPKLQQAARAYYEAAASRGSNSAKVKLAHLYPNAEFTAQDKEIMRFWSRLRKLPLNKFSTKNTTYINELLLGYFYEVGYHVECSENEAYAHYLRVNGIPGGAGIARLLHNPKCSLKDIRQDLEKRQNFGGEEGFFRILKALKYNTSVHNIGFPKIYNIKKFIKLFEDTFTYNNSITFLERPPLNIGSEIGPCLGKILKVNKALTKILLYSSGLESEAAIAIAEGLKHNNSLAELDLRFNKIGSEGAIAIAESLKHNNSLTELDLGNNSIDLQGIIAIAEGLKHNNSLTELDLRFNKIDSEGAIAIAESLVCNSSLTKVLLFFNNIGMPGGAALRDSFARNNSLRELDFRYNHTSLKGNDYYYRD
ncbi:hypothetical protein IM40_09385 (plasmid) [Candidatus Paracaedimonas acanthamoebae]|nr:hypothetical protein IM40_09385 [Candidatus Paracaedimonas acanthamoebae]